ncbi:MAG: hypothetical protein Q9216_002080 [Gyalolechia sp. 2 TL-2023]
MSSIGDSSSHLLSRGELTKKNELLDKALTRERAARSQSELEKRDLHERIDSLEYEMKILQGQLRSVQTTHTSGVDHSEHERPTANLDDARDVIPRLNEEQQRTKLDFSQMFHEYFEASQATHEQLKQLKSVAVSCRLLKQPQVPGRSSVFGVPPARSQIGGRQPRVPDRRQPHSPPVKEESVRPLPAIWNWSRDSPTIKERTSDRSLSFGGHLDPQRSVQHPSRERPLFPQPTDYLTAGGDEEDEEDESGSRISNLSDWDQGEEEIPSRPRNLMDEDVLRTRHEEAEHAATHSLASSQPTLGAPKPPQAAASSQSAFGVVNIFKPAASSQSGNIFTPTASGQSAFGPFGELRPERDRPSRSIFAVSKSPQDEPSSALPRSAASLAPGQLDVPIPTTTSPVAGQQRAGPASHPPAQTFSSGKGQKRHVS